MPYRIRHWHTLAPEIRRIAREQIDRAVGELEGEADDRHEAVHQARKRIKKIRALLRLVRPHLGDRYARENAFYRDLAKPFSKVRDAGAFVETVEALGGHFDSQVDADTWTEIVAAFARRRDRIAAADTDLSEAIPTLVRELKKGRRRIGRWPLDAFADDPDQATRRILDGLEKTYRRARHAFPAAYRDGGAEAFHEWRKRVKYHWYHLRLVRDLWKPVVGAFRDGADDLADILGDGHDLDELETLVRAGDPKNPAEPLPDRSQAFLLALVARRRQTLRQRARPMGQRLLAEKPKALRKRLANYTIA